MIEVLFLVCLSTVIFWEEVEWFLVKCHIIRDHGSSQGNGTSHEL